ncbi:MAG: efflux RND transporter periplasmic adaptor subunit [Bacteroidia bacterium]|nr:efflux RND transporter periplasmic adaptor subunit [Bacteroidia bacterium]
MKFQIIFIVVITSILGLIACSDHTDEHAPTKTVYDLEPIQVSTMDVGSQVQDARSTLSGVIQSKNKATVSARMMGYVTSLTADVGDRVRAGQTILTLRNNELPAKRAQVNAGIAEAEAALKNVKINYDRMKILWEQESITRKEWDDISAQYDMMKAKVAGARSKQTEIDEIIALTRVNAPISGVVTAKMINKGDLVNPGIPLMSIEGNQGYEVISYVSDNQIGSIKKDMQLDCYVNALDKTVKAKITEISPSSVNTGGQFAIKAALMLSPQDQKLVFPGMYANVYAPVPTTAQKTSCITVEKSALFNRGQLTGIYVVSNQNTALLRWIRVGKDFGDRVEIVSGLAPGEEYIVSDLSLLQDGIPVSK